MVKKLRLFIPCLVLLFISIFFFGVATAETNVTECGVISDGNETYVLNTSLNSGSACIYINTSDVTLDCSGYNITYGNSTDTGFGILVDNLSITESAFTNITIRNCNFIQNDTATNSSQAISIMEGAQDFVISNNTFTISANESWGIIIFDNPQNISISGNTFTISGFDNYGIFFSEQSENCSAVENVITLTDGAGTGRGAITFADSSTGANITSNNITSTSSEMSPGIYIGTSGTNFNIASNRIDILGNESSGIRILEDVYSGTIYNNVINVSGNMNIRQDVGKGGIFLGQRSYGINISSNTITTSGVNSTAIFSWGNQSTMELNNLTTSGVYSRGIYLEESTEMNLTSNIIFTIGDNSEGIFAGTRSNYTKAYDNQINTSGTDSYGILVDSSSYGNLSLNNLTGTGSYGIYVNDCMGTLVYSNEIVSATTYGIVDELSSSSNISTNTIHGTNGATFSFGMYLLESTSINVDSNVLYNNDGATTAGSLCGGISLWYSDATISNNLFYGDTNESCTYPGGIGMIFNSSSESFDITLNNNVINSSAGNNSYGIYLGDQSTISSGTNTVNGFGNTIQDSDDCIVFENGAFSISGINVSNCILYDVLDQVIFITPSVTPNIWIVNSTINVSKLNVTTDVNITLQEYVRGYVDDGTSALSGATVVLTNNNSAEQQWSKTTGSNGYTSYGAATYYFYNGTGYNYSNMTAAASKSGYDSSSTSSIISGQTDMSISLTAFAVEDSSSGGSTTSTPPFWASTYVLNENETLAFEGMGLTKELSKKNQIRIKVNGSNHHVGIINLTSSTATINVSSTPQQVVFNVGDEKMFDVNGDDYYDIKVKLNSILNNKANITISLVKENIMVVVDESSLENDGSNEGTDETLEDKKSLLWLWISLGAIFVLAIVLSTIGYFWKGNKKRK